MLSKINVGRADWGRFFPSVLQYFMSSFQRKISYCNHPDGLIVRTVRKDLVAHDESLAIAPRFIMRAFMWVRYSRYGRYGRYGRYSYSDPITKVANLSRRN